MSGNTLNNKKGIFPLLAGNCKKTSTRQICIGAIRFFAHFVTKFCNDLPAFSVYNNTTLTLAANCKHTRMYIMMPAICKQAQYLQR